MRKTVLLGCLFVAALSSARAQMAVEVVVDQDQFLPGESLPIAVRVSNRSGQTLRLGDTADWLSIAVEGRGAGAYVEKTDEVPVVGGFDLESSKVAIKRLDIAPCFNLTRPGRYLITATVRVKEWDKEFSSKAKSIDVIRGTPLWTREFGVPRAGGGPPEMRKFTLQQARYLKQLKLYVRLTDVGENKVFCVYCLGPMVSFGEPEVQMDRKADLHVLFQTSARGFLYCVVDPNGEQIIRQNQDYNDTRPKLGVNDKGEILVLGGARRFTANDIPPSDPFADATNQIPALKPESPAPTAQGQK